MSKPKVLITAVDGHTGSSIAQHLITNSAVKNALGGICGLAESGECPHLKEKGINIKQADTSSPPEKMVETFKNADVVVLVPSAVPNKLKHASNILEACQLAEVKKVVLISTAGCDIASEDKYPRLHEFKKMESEAKQMKFNLVIFRANFYVENLLLYKAQMKEGKLPLPIDNGKLAPVFLKDVAEGVGILLQDHAKCKEYIGKVVTLTGAELMTGHQMAERLSSCLGKKLEFQNISSEEAKKILAGVKELDESEAQLLLEFYCMVKSGKAEFCDPYEFEKLTGHPPTPFEDFTKCHKIEC